MSVDLFEHRRFNGLARRMQKGDSTAANELYNELVQKTFGFCFARMHDRNVAEDLTQEIFLKVVAKIDMFDVTRGSFLTWYWQLARNTLIDHFRANAKHAVAFADLEEGETEKVVRTEDVVDMDGKIAYRMVSDFVKTLSDEEQELFELRFVADLPYKRIAAITGTNAGALRVVASRLKKKIKKEFGK